MAYASNTTTASGSTANVAVPFGYINQTDVNVSLNGVVVTQSTLVWTSSTVIQLPSTPAAGTIVKVYRTTGANSLNTVFQDPSVLQGSDLNNALLQMLYVTQEAFDLGNANETELGTITAYVNTAMAAASESATAAATSQSAAAASASAGATSATDAAGSATLAQSWATTLGALVASIGYSAKEWAIGTFTRGAAGGGSAKDWATYIGGTVDDTGYSSKKYANDAATSAATAASVVNGAIIVEGAWDASAGTFPGGGTAGKGFSYVVSVAGNVNGVSFDIGDAIFATVANPSTTTYAGNWEKLQGYVSSAEVVAALGFTPMSNVVAAGSDVTTGTDNTKAVTSKALADAGVGERTGTVRLGLWTTAATGWVLFNDGSIGDAASGGTARANADCQGLFTLLYALADADCPLQTSAGSATTRGAQGSAATAWAAHCRLVLPKMLGHALGISGAGSGLTARALGSAVGAETHTLSAGESPVSIVTATVYNASDTNSNYPQTNASQTAFSLMQPTTFLNAEIKL